MSIILRIDDVCSNTDFVELEKMLDFARMELDCEIWAGVTLFSKGNFKGSVYPNPPFKDMPVENFYNVDHYFNLRNVGYDKVASHGLFHIDHSQFQYDGQEMSIVSSCRILNTDIFIPPFNKFNQTTEAVCRHYNIRLVKSFDEGWRSLEHEEFTSSHKLWYFHPWRFNLGTFGKAIEGK